MFTLEKFCKKNSVRISGSIGGDLVIVCIQTVDYASLPIPGFVCDDSIELCLPTGWKTLQFVPPQRRQLLLSLVRPVGEL